MNLDFFKYESAYARYKQGLLDPGDQSDGAKAALELAKQKHQEALDGQAEYLKYAENAKRSGEYVDPVASIAFRRMHQDKIARLAKEVTKAKKELQQLAVNRDTLAIDRDTLQLAKSIGPDLTPEEFKKLRNQVEEVHDRYKDQSAGMTNREKQESLWDLPAHFTPARFSDGTPMEISSDTTGVSELSSALSSIGPTQQDSLSEPLKKLLQPQDSGQLEQSFNHQMTTASSQLATSELAGHSDKKLGDWLGGKPLFLDKPLPEKLGNGLDSIFDTPAHERKPEDVTKWIETFRAHHDKETRAQVQKNQLSGLTSNPANGLQSSVTQDAPVSSLLDHPDKREGAPPVAFNPSVAVKSLMGAASDSAPAVESAAGGVASSMGWLDKLQMFGDAAGVADPTPIIDGANAAISVVRAFTDPKRAGEHLMNAGISAISMIPYLGDAAKLFKYGGKGAKAAAGAAKAEGAASKAGGKGQGIGAMLGGLFGGGSGAGEAAGGGGGSGSGGSGGSILGDGEDGKQAGKMLGGLTDGIAEFARAIGPAAIVVTATVGSFKMLVDWLKNVDATSRKMLEDNKDLARYNGNLAASYAKLDRDRVMRDVQASNDMAGPIGRLTKSQSRYEAAQEDLTRPFKQLSVDIQAKLTDLATGVITLVDNLEFISEILAWMQGFAKDTDEARSAAQALARNAENRAKQRRL